MISFVVSLMVGFATLYMGVYVSDAIEHQQMQQCSQESEPRRK